MKPASFAYYAPTSIDEALDKLDQLGYDGKVLAGGQSLIATMNFRMSQPAALVDLNNITELFYISPTNDGGVKIGTMTRSSKVEHDRLIAEKAPLIFEAMPNVAHPQIRNRGTFGGAIAHADPAGQAPSLVLALEAKLLVKSKQGERWVSADDFFVGPFTTVIEPQEMLVEIQLPQLPAHSGTSYKHVARQSGATSLVGCSTVVSLDNHNRCVSGRIILSCVGETAINAKESMKLLIGQSPSEDLFHAAADMVVKEIDPGSDIHATAEFRRHLAMTLVYHTLKEAFDRAKA